VTLSAPAPVGAILANDDEVLRALLRRRETGERSDGARIALVVGGGGMRGAYAGGMVHALDDAGLGGCFDVAYGTSAGAFIAAGLLLGDGRGSADIFPCDMACREFIDPRRLGTRRPMVSLDHLIDHVLVDVRPMPWARLRDSPTPLRVMATAADDLSGHALDPRTIDEWKRALRATASIPLLAGPPVELHGRRWIDGSIAEPLPVRRALAEGATHVLALLNRSVPELRGIPGRALREAAPARWAAALDRIAPGLGRMADETRRHQPLLGLLDDPGHPDRHGVYLATIAPEHGLGIRGLTTDVPRIAQANQTGYTAMWTALAAAR
jgi:predicted acylesterase/phospholipase RssA